MKYEYKIIEQSLNSDKAFRDSERELNELGQEGWRIVGVTAGEEAYGPMFVYLVKEKE